MKNPLTLDQVIPGGIRPGDFVHVGTNDRTCSRCRADVPDDDVPLMVWDDSDAGRMWIYCEACLDAAEPEASQP